MRQWSKRVELDDTIETVLEDAVVYAIGATLASEADIADPTSYAVTIAHRHALRAAREASRDESVGRHTGRRIAGTKTYEYRTRAELLADALRLCRLRIRGFVETPSEVRQLLADARSLLDDPTADNPTTRGALRYFVEGWDEAQIYDREFTASELATVALLIGFVPSLRTATATTQPSDVISRMTSAIVSARKPRKT